MYLCTRAYLLALHGRPGVIINTSSSVSDLVSPQMSSYGTSKMAVNRCEHPPIPRPVSPSPSPVCKTSCHC